MADTASDRAAIPLPTAMLCLDCDFISTKEPTACPVCGGAGRYPLEAWLALPREARTARATPRAGGGALRGATRALVMVADIHVLAFPPTLAPGLAVCLRCGLVVDPVAAILPACDPASATATWRLVLDTVA